MKQILFFIFIAFIINSCGECWKRDHREKISPPEVSTMKINFFKKQNHNILFFSQPDSGYANTIILKSEEPNYIKTDTITLFPNDNYTLNVDRFINHFGQSISYSYLIIFNNFDTDTITFDYLINDDKCGDRIFDYLTIKYNNNQVFSTSNEYFVEINFNIFK